MADRDLARPGGRHARWTSAVVLAPGAAALFGAAVSWAQTTTPTTVAQPASRAAAQSAAQSLARPAAPASTRRVGQHGVSAQARQWRQVATARHQQRRALARELSALHKHVTALRTAERAAVRAARHAAQAAPVPVVGNYQPPPVSGPVTHYVPAPAPVVAAPVQAPPVQGSTGSSGHP